MHLRQPDRGCFQRLHEPAGVADAGHHAIVDPAVDKIRETQHGAFLEFGYAVFIRQFVKILFDFLETGYVTVKDIAV